MVLGSFAILGALIESTTTNSLNDEPYSINISDVNNVEHQQKWISTTVGEPDFDNYFEFIYGNSEQVLTYYIPILNNDGAVIYILESRTNDASENDIVSGLMVPYYEINAELLNNLNKIYPEKSYVLLDTTYRHKVEGELLGSTILGLILIVFGWYIRKRSKVETVD